MRLRERRRIEKRARNLAHRKLLPWPEFRGADPEKLLKIAADRTRGWLMRADALQSLDLKTTPSFLLEEFYSSEDKFELWETALVLENIENDDVIDPLIAALQDANEHRRHAAARALGWNRHARSRSAKALTAALLDKTQPQPVREEACESLAYLNWRQATPALVAAIREPDVRLRFWAAFGLGGMHHIESMRYDPRAVIALESILGDTEAPPTYWSVGKEALGMLAKVDPKYQKMCEQEVERILADPASSKQDRSWAECYGR